jgi:hypothetical protein
MINRMRTKKPARGRPPKDAAERRSSELRIRLTADERAALDATAIANGEETSTWARVILLALVAKKSRKSGPVES